MGRRASDIYRSPSLATGTASCSGFSQGLQGFLLQVEVSEIMVHEAYEPNALVDLLDSEPLVGQHGGDFDPLAMQAKPSASGEENVAIGLQLRLPTLRSSEGTDRRVSEM
jgi:hypothetical protein